MNHIHTIAFGAPCSFMRHVQHNPAIAAIMKDALRAGQLERINHKTRQEYGEYMDILKRWNAQGAVPLMDRALEEAGKLKCIECEGIAPARPSPTKPTAQTQPA